MPTAPDIIAIRAAILAVIAAVAEAGVTHDRPRHSTREEDNVTNFIDPIDSILRTTFIRVIPPREEEDEARYKYWNIWVVELEHITVLQDEQDSFGTFWAEVEAIKNAVRADVTIFGCPERDTQRVLNVDVMDEILFVKSLCHRATMSMEIESSEVIAP